jgi:hypothetical protein
MNCPECNFANGTQSQRPGAAGARMQARDRDVGIRQTFTPPRSNESALVEEMRRLRAFPGNCDLANQLIDLAIAVQIEAEARQLPNAPGSATGGEVAK